MYNYFADKNNSLSFDEKVKLAIKHQIFIEGTSLFTEVELSGKITSPMIFEENNNSSIIYDQRINEEIEINKEISNINNKMIEKEPYNNNNENIKELNQDDDLDKMLKELMDRKSKDIKESKNIIQINQTEKPKKD